tara:strand:- start:14195 stop:14476 length:282 start_codon:yes stop_codon:yes gene_type:complete
MPFPVLILTENSLFVNTFSVFSLNIRIMSKEDLSVTLGKVDERTQSIKEDIDEVKSGISGLDRRLRIIEDWRIWVLGWTAAISFGISLMMKGV